MKILLIGKQDDVYFERAKEFTQVHCSELTVVQGKRGEAMPAIAHEWTGDYLISYLSPWIIPKSMLDQATQASINFHPGPPEYPGIGCTNFALYHNASTFGITCHHMAASVDTGKLIAIRRFPILPAETVYSLTHRCYAEILSLYYEILTAVLLRQRLPETDETWQRQPFKRSELNALCELSLDMSDEEIARRVRALRFPGMPGAYLQLGGHTFAFLDDVSTN